MTVVAVCDTVSLIENAAFFADVPAGRTNAVPYHAIRRGANQTAELQHYPLKAFVGTVSSKIVELESAHRFTLSKRGV